MPSKNKPPRVLIPLDATSSGRVPAVQGQVSAVIELEDAGDHIKKLKGISLATKHLMDLVADQLQGLSATIPLLRGSEIVKELRERSEERREGLEGAFEPLRAYIEREKALFFTKHAEVIEGIIQKRVEQGVRQRFPVVLKEKLGRYEEYVKTNSVLTDGVKQAMGTMSARISNSVLSPNYPDEQVSLIPPRTNWSSLTLGNLKNISGPAAVRLAKDQGLTPLDDSDSELARVHNLNIILRHVGIAYQTIPSRNGLLLVSLVGQRNH